jgi:hypothetical protein
MNKIEKEEEKKNKIFKQCFLKPSFNKILKTRKHNRNGNYNQMP